MYMSLWWSKFLGNYPDQWPKLLGFFSPPSYLPFSFSCWEFFLWFSLSFCFGCQSHVVGFNHLQTEPGTSHSFGFILSNLSEWHTLLTMLSIQPQQINWFQQFKSAINVSFPNIISLNHKSLRCGLPDPYSSWHSYSRWPHLGGANELPLFWFSNWCVTWKVVTQPNYNPVLLISRDLQTKKGNKKACIKGTVLAEVCRLSSNPYILSS